VYNLDALLALDWVVAEAGAAGIQVVLSLTDNWKYYNGADQVSGWVGGVRDVEGNRWRGRGGC
jgi:endo-1,4-beta-mannosidase